MVADFDYALTEAYRIAAKKDPINEDIIVVLTDFIKEIILHGFDKKDFPLLAVYRNVPLRTYKLILHNELGEKILYSYLKEFLHTIEIINYKNRHEEIDNNSSDSALLIWVYAFYIDFLKIILEKNEEKVLIKVLKEYRESQSGDNLSTEKIRLLDKLKGENYLDKEEIIDKYIIDNYTSIIYRHVSLSVKSWFLMLFQVGRIDENRIKLIIDNLPRYYDVNDIIFDILLIVKKGGEGYLGLGGWEYRDPELEDTTGALAPRLWIHYGLFELLSNNIIEHQGINFDYIPNDNQFRFIYNDVQHIFGGVRRTPEKWTKLFNLSGKDQEEKNINFENKLRKIENIFGTLKARTELLIDKEIAEQAISQEKVDNFLEILAKTWNENNASYALFDAVKNVKIKESKEGLDQQPKYGRQYHFLERFKMAFVEKHGQPIYGVGDIALWSARQTSDTFLHTIIETKVNNTNNLSASNSIERGISQLEKAGYSPNLIIVPPEFSYKTDLHTSPNFKPSWELGSEETIANLGLYKNIPVFTFYSPFLKNHVIISKFEKAFELEIYENESLKYRRLHLSLREITDVEIEQKFSEDKDMLRVDKVTGIELTDGEIKIRIKNTMVLEMFSYANFKIIDSNAYEVAIVDIEGD